MSAAVNTDTGEVVPQCDERRARDLTDKIKTSLSVAWELIKDAYHERAWATLGYDSWDHYVTEEFSGHRVRLPREERREVVGSLREAGMSVRAIASATGDHYSTVSRDLSEGVANETPERDLDDKDDHSCDFTKWDVCSCGRELSGRGRARRPDDPVCDDCGEEFSTEVWHCPDCDHHWPLGSGECKNCLSFTADPPQGPKVTGTDGKQYPVAPSRSPQPAKPRRRPLPDVFFDACHDLTKTTDRIVRLTDDDRFTTNRKQVAAKHRSDLLRARDAINQAINRLDEG